MLRIPPRQQKQQQQQPEQQHGDISQRHRGIRRIHLVLGTDTKLSTARSLRRPLTVFQRRPIVLHLYFAIVPARLLYFRVGMLVYLRLDTLVLQPVALKAILPRVLALVLKAILPRAPVIHVPPFTLRNRRD